MSSEGIGEPLLVLPPLGPIASRESGMDGKLGELATKNWDERRGLKCVCYGGGRGGCH